MSWRLPTYRDAHPDHDGALVACPCGRRQTADMMFDCRALPPEMRTALFGDAAYICDGCRERVIRDGLVLRETLASALGAPAETVTALRAHAEQHDSPHARGVAARRWRDAAR